VSPWRVSKVLARDSRATTPASERERTRIKLLDGGLAMKPSFACCLALALVVVGVLWATNLLDRPDLAFLDGFVASASATLALAFLDSRGLL